MRVFTKVVYYLVFGVFLILSVFALWVYPTLNLGLEFSKLGLKEYYGAVTPILALVLGMFYYFHKLRNDHDLQEANRSRGQIRGLREELERYNGFVLEILYPARQDQMSLDSIRHKVGDSFDNLRCMFKMSGMPNHLRSALNSVIALHSLVDNDSELMESSADALPVADIKSQRTEYAERVALARQELYRAETCIR